MDNPVKSCETNGDLAAGATKVAVAVSEDAALAGAGIKPGANTAPPAPEPQQDVTSSSLKAIMGTVSSAPAPAVRSPGLLPAVPETQTPSSSALKTMLGVSGSIGGGGGGGIHPTGAPPPTPPLAATAERPVGYDPKIGVPQLLLERGGRIRITALWEAYRLRFGETQYTLKDLFCEPRFCFCLCPGSGLPLCRNGRGKRLVGR